MIWRLPLAGLVGALLTLALLWLWLPSDPALTAAQPGARTLTTPLATMERLGAIWSYHEPWSMRSINFREIASPRWLDSPLIQVALWAALSSGLWLAAARRLDWRRRLNGCLALLLLGWLVLDLHWQGRLLARLKETQAQYAGLTNAEAVRAREPETTLAQAADALRAQLPDSPTRVLLITRDPGSYAPLRLRYHLLPLNVHPGMAQLPAPTHLRAGDFLLVIDPPPDLGYKGAQQQLVQGSLQIPAEQVLALPGVASLFRVP